MVRTQLSSVFWFSLTSLDERDSGEELPEGERFLLLPLFLESMSYFSVSKMSFQAQYLIERWTTYGDALSEFGSTDLLHWTPIGLRIDSIISISFSAPVASSSHRINMPILLHEEAALFSAASRLGSFVEIALVGCEKIGAMMIQGKKERRAMKEEGCGIYICNVPS